MTPRRNPPGNLRPQRNTPNNYARLLPAAAVGRLKILMQNGQYSAPERRNSLREPMQSIAYVRLGEENGGIIVNLGEGGLAVRAAVALPYDRVPVLFFQLAGFPHAVVTSGRIAWKSDSGKLVGIQFVDMHDSMRNIIKSWLAEENSSRAPREPHVAAQLPDEGRRDVTVEDEAVSDDTASPHAVREDPDLPRLDAPSPATPSHLADVVPQQMGSESFAAPEPADFRWPSDAPDHASAAPEIPRQAAGPLVVTHSPSVSDNLYAPSADILRATYVSHARKGRTALLMAMVAALSGMAGWAIGHHSFSRAFSPTPGSASGPGSGLAPSKMAPPVAAAAGIANARPAVRDAPQGLSSATQGWIFLGRITPQATWTPDSPANVSTRWPVSKGDQITLSHDVWIRADSEAVSRSSAPVVGVLRAGETALVEDVALLHARLGGNFVWVKVSRP